MTPSPEATIEVIAGAAPSLSSSSLVVRVAPYSPSSPTESTLGVAIADLDLADRMTRALTAAVAHAVDDVFASPPAPLRPIRLRSRATAARRTDLPGALALVPVTDRNARHLLALVTQLRAAGVAGVQLVWDGASPSRPRCERHVFAVLEHARATPAGPPVVLAATPAPAAALQLLIAHRSRSQRGTP